MHKKCGCVEKVTSSKKMGLNLCDIFNGTQRRCRQVTEAQFYLPSENAKALRCDCQPKCHEVDYIPYISHTKWPTDAYMQLKILNFMKDHKVSNMFLTSLIADNYESHFTYKQYNNEDPPRAEDNLVRLHIYYESLTYELIQELPSYPMSQLWADFGGVVGLYLGMTAATAIEVVQLFVLIVVNCCRKKGKRQVSKVSSSDLESIYEDKGANIPQAPTVA